MIHFERTTNLKFVFRNKRFSYEYVSKFNLQEGRLIDYIIDEEGVKSILLYRERDQHAVVQFNLKEHYTVHINTYTIVRVLGILHLAVIINTLNLMQNDFKRG